MASQVQYFEASQFFELETSCSWIIAASGSYYYDQLKFNLDHLKGAGHRDCEHLNVVNVVNDDPEFKNTQEAEEEIF